MVTGRPQLIAHRGFAGEFQENTLEAVQGSIGMADAIELDVRQCGSGDLVIVHDPYVGDGHATREIEQLSVSTLSSAEPPVPTLESVLAVVPDDQRLVLELKDPKAADDLGMLLHQSKQNAVISATDGRALSRISQRYPDLETAFLHIPPLGERLFWKLAYHLPISRVHRYDTTKLISQANRASCNEIHLRYELCLQTEIVQQAHKAGLTIAAWTVNSPADYLALRNLGVDGIISDTWRVDSSLDS